MKLYSDFAAQRTRQIVADVLALLAIAGSIWLGVAVHASVVRLAQYGEQMKTAGGNFRTSMDDIGSQLGGIPLVGGGISDLFGTASNAGANLEAAGQSQEDSVHGLAAGLGWGTAVLPIIAILLVWLVTRLRFAIRAGRLRRIHLEEGSIDLLALRALGNQKLSALRAIDAEPAAAWRRGDPEVLLRLASLELREGGVRVHERALGR